MTKFRESPDQGLLDLDESTPPHAQFNDGLTPDEFPPVPAVMPAFGPAVDRVAGQLHSVLQELRALGGGFSLEAADFSHLGEEVDFERLQWHLAAAQTAEELDDMVRSLAEKLAAELAALVEVAKAPVEPLSFPATVRVVLARARQDIGGLETVAFSAANSVSIDRTFVRENELLLSTIFIAIIREWETESGQAITTGPSFDALTTIPTLQITRRDALTVAAIGVALEFIEAFPPIDQIEGFDLAPEDVPFLNPRPKLLGVS